MKRTLPRTVGYRAHRLLINDINSPASPTPSLERIPRPRYPTCFSLFTLPNDTKDDVLEVLRQTGRPPSPIPPPPADPVAAAIVLASPRHASWLNDMDFMTRLVRHLRVGSFLGDAQPTKYRVLAAVVDGLPAVKPDGVVQEGFSIATGLAERIVPSLYWAQKPNSPPDTTPSSISLMYSGCPIDGTLEDPKEPSSFSITLPLANTLFSTGRHHTLLASEWAIIPSLGHEPKIELSRIEEKQDQTVYLGRLIARQKNDAGYSNFSVHCRLDPITRPRIVHRVLGNIISEVEIDGVGSPASEELQRELPLWLENRKKQSPAAANTGRVSVWALVTPWRLIYVPGTSLLASYERLSWRSCEWFNTSLVDTLVQKGARLHRVLSGGGEWGAKASLIALDPQVKHQRPSEEESLDLFQTSFRRVVKGNDLIVKPGDVVQFFVESEEGHSLFSRQYKPPVWATKWGVGDVNGESELREKQVLQHSNGTTPSMHRQFGGYSAEGIYLSVPALKLNTKIDVPGGRVDAHVFRDAKEDVATEVTEVLSKEEEESEAVKQFYAILSPKHW